MSTWKAQLKQLRLSQKDKFQNRLNEIIESNSFKRCMKAMNLTEYVIKVATQQDKQQFLESVLFLFIKVTIMSSIPFIPN